MKALRSISRWLTKEKLEALFQYKYKNNWYKFNGIERPFKFRIEVYEEFQEINKNHYCIDMHFSEDDSLPTFRVYISDGDGYLATNGKGNYAKNYKMDTWYIYSDLASVLLGQAFESKYKVTVPNRKNMNPDAFYRDINGENNDIVLAYKRDSRVSNGNVGYHLGDYVLYYNGYTKLDYMYQKKIVDELYIMQLNNSVSSMFIERYTIKDLGILFDTQVLEDLYLAREFYSDGDDVWYERKWFVSNYGELYTMNIAKKQKTHCDDLKLSKLNNGTYKDADAAEDLKKLGIDGVIVNSKGEALPTKRELIDCYKEALIKILGHREETKYADTIEDEIDLSKI